MDKSMGYLIRTGRRKRRSSSDLSNLGLPLTRVNSFFRGLTDNTFITKLNLYNNVLGDAGVAVLAETLLLNGTLVEINLGNTNIGDFGATALANALKANRRVAALNLSQNMISAPGVTALMDSLKSSNLRELYLRQCLIAEDSAEELLTIPSSSPLVILDVSGNLMDPELEKEIFTTLEQTVASRKACRKALTAVLGMRNYRKTVLDTQPRDVVRMICRILWEQRRSRKWTENLLEREIPAKRRK